jgi:outer membrane protein assembly factor BamB
VGWIDPGTGQVTSRGLGEGITNSFAVDDSGGVFIVTDRALYRFDARKGNVEETWRVAYENSGVAKPGQSDAGSGTTPTILGRNYVAITDNADPMQVMVVRRKADLKVNKRFGKKKHRRRRGERARIACQHDVFEPGAGSTDQSLIVAGRSIVTENNFGYTGPLSVQDGRTTVPGLERVDLRKRGRGCRTVWHSDEIAPSVVPKLSLANGLVYTYTKPPRDDGADVWFLTAIDFHTGETVWKRFAGEGLGFNNNFAPVTLAPDGTAYVGVLGGLVRFADGS